MLEISYMNLDLNVSQQLKDVLALKLHKKVSMRKVVNSKRMDSLRESMAQNMRFSITGCKNLKEQLKDQLVQGDDKLISEIKAINSWKKITRKLKPEENYKKEFYQAEFLLIAGNYERAINYVRSAIQDFT